MYFLPKWKNPGRKRNCKANHNSPDYCKYYDLDIDDFTNLVVNLRNGKHLSFTDNERYAMYVYTMIYIVLENPKFKQKSMVEKSELFEQAIFELLQSLPKFEIDRGSSIYSFAYRCCYISFIHYYENKKNEFSRQQSILNHCWSELDEYLYEFDDHKVNNINKE